MLKIKVNMVPDLFYPYLIILVIMLFFYGGFIFQLKAPLVTVWPDITYGLKNDLAMTNYFAYIAGHHLLHGFSTWSFNETLGNNLYVDLHSYLRPTNLVGAALVDYLHFDIFQVFGSLSFLMLLFAAASFYYYLNKILDYTLGWSIFGACLYIFSPTIAGYAQAVNYLGIFMFFPLLLIILDKFYKRPGLKNSIFFVLLIACPLFFGMINIYLNYFILAVFCSFYYLFKIKKAECHKFPTALFSTIVVFITALMLNSFIWLPFFYFITRSKLPVYNFPYDMQLINPIMIPLQLIRNILFDYHLYMSAVINRVMALLSRGNQLLFYGYLPTITSGLSTPFFIYGIWILARKKEFQLYLFWFFGLLTVGFICFIFYFLNIPLLNYINIVKFIKYQIIIAAPFLVIIQMQGIKEILFDNSFFYFKNSFKKILIAFLIINFISLVSIILLSFSFMRGFIINFLTFFNNNIHLLENSKRVFNIIYSVPIKRSQLFWTGANFYIYLFYMAIVIPAAYCILKIINNRHRYRFNIINKIAACLILISAMYLPFMQWGGFVVKNEVFAKDFFAIQKNEVIVKKILQEDGNRYRVLYFDNVCKLKELFPDDPVYNNLDISYEKCRNNSMIFIHRASAFGIPIADGLLTFPGAKKFEFFSDKTLFNFDFGIYNLSVKIINPFDKRLPRLLNIKYILSHYPLPYFRLINKNEDYWGYLYEIKEAEPICTIASLEQSESAVAGKIKSFKIGYDEMEVVVDAKNNAMVNLNMTLDGNWKAYIDGEQGVIHPIKEMFSGIKVRSGKHTIILKHKFSPFLLFSKNRKERKNETNNSNPLL